MYEPISCALSAPALRVYQHFTSPGPPPAPAPAPVSDSDQKLRGRELKARPVTSEGSIISSQLVPSDPFVDSQMIGWMDFDIYLMEM